MTLTEPHTETRVLDIGVTNSVWRSANFLEASYPWQANISAVALADVPVIRSNFPDVRVVEPY